MVEKGHDDDAACPLQHFTWIDSLIEIAMHVFHRPGPAFGKPRRHVIRTSDRSGLGDAATVEAEGFRKAFDTITAIRGGHTHMLAVHATDTILGTIDGGNRVRSGARP